MADPWDPWRMGEWERLPDECLIAGCDDTEICPRGPIWLRDGTMHKACTEHWDAIIGVLGRRLTWERDAGRSSAPL